jgi:hypothetical protein
MKNLFDEIFKVKIQGCDETYFLQKYPFFIKVCQQWQAQWRGG